MMARASKSGVSISPDDLAALNAKRVTLQDLADRERCTKQNVSKRIRAMKAASPAATAPASTSTGPTSIPAGAVLIDPAATAISACLAILSRTVGLLESPDQIGPTGLKALSTTISTVADQLRQLRVLASDDDESTLSTLTVRVMSEAEHIATKLRVEELNDYDD
jgi:hypothetical protein